MNKYKRLMMVGLVVTLFMSLLPMSSVAAGSFLTKTYNGRSYKVYVPERYQAGTKVPLVVMLHGCTQDATQFSSGTQMNNLAEIENFLVLYPEQPSSANSNKCWNWFESAHQSRGSGEPALIAGMVNQVKSDYTIDDNRVYVGGLSAGAAMSVIMGATYPDIFAAISVGAGLEYKAATSLTGAFTAMNSGGPNPSQQGDAAYNAMGAYKRVVPVIVFHGTSDTTVYPVNGHQVISQWAQTNDRASDGVDNNNMDDTADQTVMGTVSGGRSYTQYIYKDHNGTAIMEKYIVDGMGHAWSGGSTAGSYTDPKGPNATQLSWNFFKSHPKAGSNPTDDITPPVTSASPAGGTYTNPVNVTLSVNEEATIYYTVDGRTPTTSSAIYSEPISIAKNTRLTFFSVDSKGNQESIKSETYTISAPSETGTSFTSIASEDGFVGALPADGLSSTVHKMGDKGMYNTDTYRTILSFDTSNIPDSATIKSVKLKVYRKSLSGSVNAIRVDVKNGWFGTSSTLQQGDYSAAASALDVGALAVPSANNEYTEVELRSTAYSHVNKAGKTQIRLVSTTPVDFAMDTLEIYAGEDSAYAPALSVTYE
ncbi:PHB depolymerase family esterase [Metabacillus iocasae]|uniref:Poly(Hydroxyalkanoate) depolymerase family esterase n=1 Tax=Priestia iocasae TaxID=2291674 RepID=A0ABS2QSK9_9BACI|nr:PHB depolymerase family esterase [Metabacillus iocasae]MBM7702450.1 poly(hydroxyalkanoate) depolymerase family esterase [Metabacillus iocasae]